MVSRNLTPKSLHAGSHCSRPPHPHMHHKCTQSVNGSRTATKTCPPPKRSPDGTETLLFVPNCPHRQASKEISTAVDSVQRLYTTKTHMVILHGSSVVVAQRKLVACVDQEVIGHSHVLIVVYDLRNTMPKSSIAGLHALNLQRGSLEQH